MAKVNLPYSVTIGIKAERHNLEAGEQEVSAEVEKALVDAGVIEKKAPVKTEK